jgi:hypothetical protein
MQVRLTTTISTIIDIDPENTTEFATAKAEIFGTYNTNLGIDARQEQSIEAVQALQSGSVIYDRIVGTEVTHSFEEVK